MIFNYLLSDCCFFFFLNTALRQTKEVSGRIITVIAAPVDVDATAVGAGELGQREAGRVS